MRHSNKQVSPLFSVDEPAWFSRSMVYRYWLRRVVDEGHAGERPCVWIMLNPSTATSTDNDPTTRRCMGFAERWGYTDHVAVNLFAFRSPEPDDLRSTMKDPIGRDNDAYIRRACKFANARAVRSKRRGIIVCAWGNGGFYMSRATEVLQLIHGYPVHCLGLNQTGEPRFPLYLPNATKPIRWRTNNVAL